ncbi:cytochrome c biogenesis CcdA family protein [Kitasatospora sp. NPDC089913]|uniref:cytochrome c biogenesis CcdA family protein n=1 Tax=Kitasatospora sp. NPDC089913 TaxID=3364080 RepID=UPI0038299C5F
MEPVATAVDGSQAVFTGALVLAIPVAALAGLLSFLSPCILPLVPGYLSYVTGFSAADLADAGGRKRGQLVLGTVLFVLGFTAVFVSAGALFGYFGNTLVEHRRTVEISSGVVTILMGIVFSGLFSGVLSGISGRELRSRYRPAVGLAGAPVLGIVFGVGWTPCIGPTASAVQTLALSESDPARGALLGLFYCAGLGIPFVVSALVFRRAMGTFGWVRRHHRGVVRFGGGMLVLVGVMLLTGAWADLVDFLRVWAAGHLPDSLVAV